jgi:hypothetical protein
LSGSLTVYGREVVAVEACCFVDWLAQLRRDSNRTLPLNLLLLTARRTRALLPVNQARLNTTLSPTLWPELIRMRHTVDTPRPVMPGVSDSRFTPYRRNVPWWQLPAASVHCAYLGRSVLALLSRLSGIRACLCDAASPRLLRK